MDFIDKAYLLHSRPYRETSALIRVFDQHHGVIAAIAKGGAKKSALQPFCPFSAKISGKSDLKTLLSPEQSGKPTILQPQNALCGLYINELIMATCAEYDPHPIIYQAYIKLLEDLTQKNSAQVLLRRFEQKLFSDIGYQLPYNMDNNNREIASNKRYNLGEDWMFVQHAYGKYSGESLLGIAEDNYGQLQTQRDARMLAREIVMRITGRKLNSWKLFG